MNGCDDDEQHQEQNGNSHKIWKTTDVELEKKNNEGEKNIKNNKHHIPRQSITAQGTICLCEARQY